jgi:hypothetical protein
MMMNRHFDSGILHRIFDNKIAIFEQGEGVVNTLGGFYGSSKRLKLNLLEAGIFKHDDPSNAKKITVYNWNGKKSPMVHQYDRFNAEYFEGKQGKDILTAFDGII